MEALVALLMLPIIVLNLLGGIIGGIWLMINGDWSTFLWGVAYIAFGAFAVSLLLMPGIVLAVPVLKLVERGHTRLAALAGFPSMLWTYAVVMGSCIWIFGWVMSRVEGSPIPYLLWSYAVATAPWTYMAQKESQSGNEYGTYAAFGAQLGVISLFFAYFNDPYDLSFGRLIWWFAPLMIVVLAFSVFAAWVETRQARLRSYGEF